MRHHNTWYGVVLMAAWIVLAAAPPALAQGPDVLRVGYAEPDTLDPHLAVIYQSQGIVRFLYRGLTRFAIRDGRVTTSEVDPDLAESWIEPDGDDLTWVFRLRRGVLFHKGFGEMTAEDVKFSFERQMHDPQRMAYAKNLDVISSIEVVNNRTLWITLNHPDPIFLLRLAGYQQGYIVSKKAVQQFNEQFAWNPVGTGPFYFEQRIKNEKIILKAHHAYRNPYRSDEESSSAYPNISEVHWFDVRDDATKLLGLKYGGFDIIYPNVITNTVLKSLKQDGVVLDKRGPGTQWHLFFNTAQQPFDNIDTRRAVMSAIDRKAIIEAVVLENLSTLATSPLPSGHFGHIPVEIPTYDPERAKAFLSRSGHTPLSLPPQYISESFEYSQMMVLMQKQLEAVGINMPLRPVPHAAYTDGISDDRNAIVLVGFTRITDGDVVLGLFYHSSQRPNPRVGKKGMNFSHYEGIDDLLADARRATNDDDRAKLFHEAQKRLMRDAVVLPIAVVPDMSLRNSKRVRSPFPPELGEFALHYFYNYPELFELRQ